MTQAGAEITRAIRLNEIHIHILRTKDGPISASMERFLRFLSPEERGRFAEFELEEQRKEFLWSRLLVRRVLANCLGKEVGNQNFSYEDNGKPFLRDSEVQFNISHTEGLIACSVGSKRLGIDVEKVNTKGSGVDWNFLAHRFFSDVEREYLFSQEPGSQKACFFQIFTLKEARVKAQGKGLRLPFPRFTVPLPPDGKQTRNPWEYVNRYLTSDDVHLAHVVENPMGVPLVYRFWEWNEEFLERLLNGDKGSGIVGFKPTDFEGLPQKTSLRKEIS